MKKKPGPFLWCRVIQPEQKVQGVWGWEACFECTLEGRTGDGGRLLGQWIHRRRFEIKTKLQLHQDPRPPQSQSFSLLISFQNPRDPTLTSEEAVCCCPDRCCRCCTEVSLQCSVDLRRKERGKKNKTKDPVADPGADRLLRQDSPDTQSRPSGCCQRHSRATKTKCTGEGKLPQQPWNSASA